MIAEKLELLTPFCNVYRLVIRNAWTDSKFVVSPMVLTRQKKEGFGKRG